MPVGVAIENNCWILPITYSLDQVLTLSPQQIEAIDKRPLKWVGTTAGQHHKMVHIYLHSLEFKYCG